MEDMEIIQLLKKRNSYDEGMQRLIKKYGGLVQYMIGNILGRENERDIEECLSDVFYEFWKHIERYDLTKGSLKNYIVGIARYIALNRYHALFKYQQRHILVDEENAESQMELDMEEQIIKEIDHAIIKEEILKMEKPDRDIFIRRFFWFEKIKEIARALNLEDKQVENRLYKGKERLRKKLVQRGVENSERLHR